MKILIFLPADDSPNENMTLLPADNSLHENRDGDREDGEADDSPTCWYSQIVTGLVISYLLMIPLMKIGMVT
jgi:hypothetical protein